MALPDLEERLVALGFEPVGSTPEEFGTRFAFKYATAAHLKLKPPVLYLLGGETIPLDEINAILKVAETDGLTSNVQPKL